MGGKHRWCATVLGAMLASPALAAGDKVDAAQRGLDLPPALRQALVGEMRSVETQMHEALSALARGDWQRLAQAARTIEGAFILKQELTPAQKAELHRRLPAPFVRLDRDFHRTAGRLAAAAADHDAELATFYTSQMMESCVRCHGRYAPQRFPGLVPGPGGDAR